MGRRVGRRPAPQQCELHNYIYRVLKQVHPDTSMLKISSAIVNDLLTETYRKIVFEMVQLAEMNNKPMKLESLVAQLRKTVPNKEGELRMLGLLDENNDITPVARKYCRASIVIGANIIRPIPTDKRKCKLSMLTQLDPGGIIPSVVINSVCSDGPLGFFDGVSKSITR